MRIIFALIAAFLLGCGLMTESLSAQTDNRARIAASLFSREDYDRALPIYEDLFKEFPTNSSYFDRYADCLIYTGRYKQMTSILKEAENANLPPLNLLLKRAHLHLAESNREQALEILINPPKSIAENSSFYFEAGQLLAEYRAFEAATQVYAKGRSMLGNPRLFTNEIAMTALQAGEYETAATEFIQLIQLNPSQINYIQRLWQRFGDQQLFDQAIFKLETLQQVPSENMELNKALGRLLLWCYQERKLDRKALFWAKKIERMEANMAYFPVLNLANSFSAREEYELAESAYSFYLEDTSHPIYKQVLSSYIENKFAAIRLQDQQSLLTQQELALKWSELNERIKSWLNKSIVRSDALLREELMLSSIEIQLLEESNLDSAKVLLEDYNFLLPESKKRKLFFEGILALFERDFVSSRLFLSRAIRLKPANRELDDQASFFLAYSELLNAQYEFAMLQLKRFRKETTSYYANEALEWRALLIESAQKSPDTTVYNPGLVYLARADWHLKKNERKLAKSMLDSLSSNSSPVLKQHAYVGMLKNDFELSTSQIQQILSFLNEDTSQLSGVDELIWHLLLYNQRRQRSELIKEDELVKKLLLEYPTSVFANQARQIFNPSFS